MKKLIARVIALLSISVVVFATLPPTQAAENASAAGGNLVVGVTADPDTIFPWKALKITAVSVLENLYSTLTEFDEDMNVIPGLARAWKTSSNGLDVTFAIRRGVTFSDGTPLTSKDVKSSLDRIKNPATGALAMDSLAAIRSVEAISPYTVVLHLSQPYAALTLNLASINTAILASGDTEEQLSKIPNGTGPFVMKERVPSQKLILVKNKKYWNKNEPKLDSVEFRVIPDESSLASAVRAGNVQLAAFTDPLVAKVAAAPNIKVTKTLQQFYQGIILNSRRGDLANVNVRLAIQCAIDRQEVIDSAVLGEGKPTGPVTLGAFRSNPDQRPCPKRDLGKAAEYLKKAGKPNGVTIGMVVSQGLYATSLAVAQNLKAQLAVANITLNLEVLSTVPYVKSWSGTDRDSVLVLAGGGSIDPDAMYGRYFTSTGSLNQVAGYSSATLDQLFAAGKVATNKAKRKAIYDKIWANLENNAVWIWLFQSYSYTATASSVGGFVPMPNSSLKYLRTTTLSK